jgi:hypothetical protein
LIWNNGFAKIEVKEKTIEVIELKQKRYFESPIMI